MLHPRPLAATVFVLFIYLIVFWYKDYLTGSFYQDESHYYQTTLQFSQEPVPSVKLLKTYGELNTPLPFVLGGWVVSWFGPQIKNLRIMNFILSFLILCAFIWLAPRAGNRFWLCILGLALFPNFYLCSVHYYTDIISLTAVLSGLIFYQYRIHWLSAVCFVGAVWSRQYMIAFPAAIAAYEIASQHQKGNALVSGIRSALFRPFWLNYVAAVLSLLPWVLLWKGFAPAAEMARQYYETGKFYTVGFVLYSAAGLGFYYVLPEALFTRSWSYYWTYPSTYPRLFWSLVAIVLAIVLLFPAIQTHNRYFTWPYLGYFDRLIMLAGLEGFFKQLIFGVFMLVTLMRFITPVLSLGGWIVLANLMILGKAQLSWDKYLLPTLMTLWFLALFDLYWPLNVIQTRAKN